VGITYRVAGPHGWNVFAWQLLLGVASVLLVRRLTLRLFGSETVAALAGALAVLAPVPLFYEVTLLRDGLVAVLTLALAWAMAWAPDGTRRRWLLLGLAFGAAALVKQTFLVFPIAMGAWRLVTVRAPARDRLAAAGLAAAGILVALLPAIVRNLAVGVPPLAMNGSAAAMLPLNHTSVADVFGIRVDASYVRALIASDGSPLRALWAAAGTHPEPWSLLRLELQKVLYAWHGYEAPNNVDFYLFRQAAPVLAWLPARFVVLVPLAAVGLSRVGRRAWPLLVAVAASLPSLVLASVLARYRAAMVLPLLPLAAAGLVQLGAWIAARRWRPIAAAALLSAGYLAWATGEPPGKGDAARAAEYAWAGWTFAGLEPEYAELNLREALRLAPDDAKARALLGQLERARLEREAALRRILEERP
jgi:4-amino-4-deoxy-L-arabinose transferase-like glycosyltransferase